MVIISKLNKLERVKEAKFKLLINLFWWLITIIGLIYMYYNNMISIKRIENWVFILFIIIFYILILKFFSWYVSDEKNSYFYEKDENGNLKKFIDFDTYILLRKNFKERQSKEFINIKKKWIKLINIALILTKLINPIFWLLLQINIRLVFFCRWMNWKFKKYENFRKIIYFIFLYCINYPILIILWFYYRIISKWKWEPFYKSIFKRISGWFITMIWITIIGEEFYYFYKGKEIFFLLILYFILILISINHEFFFKYKPEFDIRFIKMLEIRKRSTGLGFIIDIAYTYEILLEETVKDYYAFDGSLGSNRTYLMLLCIMPTSVLEMMNEIKYKPCLKYYGFISTYYIIYNHNKLYYAKNYYKNKNNKQLANEYYELYFEILKNLIFMKLDILKFIFKKNEVSKWIIIDENYCSWELNNIILHGDDIHKKEFYKLVKINEVEGIFLDLNENLNYFSNNVWFWDLKLRYKIMGWQDEIENISKEENINKYLLDENINKEKNLDFKNRINKFIKEWEEKNIK